MTFLQIGIIDIIDVFVVAYIFYQIYMLTKGTGAIKIITGVAILYFIWLLVKALNMRLLSSILAQVMGVGVIALLIVFQQEIRIFFMHISNKYLSNFELKVVNFIQRYTNENPNMIKSEEIISACVSMSASKTGALIVISQKSELKQIIGTGTSLNSDISSKLIENIFFKNSPLHDGAVVISKDKIKAAGCILPVSKSNKIPENFGLRHRSGVGITEETDAIVIIVSEETGKISLFEGEKRFVGISETRLREIFTGYFSDSAYNFNEKQEAQLQNSVSTPKVNLG